MLQQIIIDPYIRKLKSCALTYRCVGEENFYLKRLGARQSRLISVLTFGNGGLAVRQSSCWLTSRWATHWAKWRSSFYHVEYVPPLLNIFAVKERLILNIFVCLRKSVVLFVSHLLRLLSNELKQSPMIDQWPFIQWALKRAPDPANFCFPCSS